MIRVDGSMCFLRSWLLGSFVTGYCCLHKWSPLWPAGTWGVSIFFFTDDIKHCENLFSLAITYVCWITEACFVCSNLVWYQLIHARCIVYTVERSIGQDGLIFSCGIQCGIVWVIVSLILVTNLDIGADWIQNSKRQYVIITSCITYMSNIISC